MSRSSHLTQSQPVRVAHTESDGHAWIVLYTAETDVELRRSLGTSARSGEIAWEVAAELCRSMSNENFREERRSRSES